MNQPPGPAPLDDRAAALHTFDQPSLPTWSSAARSVWGKSSRDQSGGSVGEWLPLAQHLLDSADVAARVWQWLPLHVRELIEADLPAGARDGQALLRWLAGIHDIGKASPPFLEKVPALAAGAHAHGLLPPTDATDYALAPHGLVGHVILQRWLREHHGAPLRAARGYAVVVGGHHGVPPTYAQLQWLRNRPHLVGDAAWERVQNEILDQIAAHTGADRHLPLWASHRLQAATQVLLTGAVILSDWIASNTDLFNLSHTDSDVAPVIAGRGQAGWDRLNLAGGWNPARPPAAAAEHLRARFTGLTGDPRPVQELTVAAAQACTEPSLLIVEAAMGSGKTEAALMATEILAERFECGGAFVGLPTMATADGLFGRVLDWIGHLEGEGVATTYLAHGKAGLNDDYRGLLTQPAQLADIHDDQAGTAPGREQARIRAEVQGWLTGRKKGVLASMVVGTIDQLLFMGLQAKHVVLRHLAMAGKVVVLDEVHAADDYMRMYLCRALEWLAAYRVPVILLSATLPASQRQELADAYRTGLDLPSIVIPAADAYPLVTSIGPTGQTSHAIGPEVETNTVTSVQVRTISEDPGDLRALLGDWLVDGGCVAVIRNTVARAQATARDLREHFGEDVVVLHHSRFIATHRAQREAHLRSELGRNGTRPRLRIVVGTQVLEQSLDVDFDAIITDIAPMDLLLQRTGRLHRHPRPRPAAMRQPTVAIGGVRSWTADGPVFDSGSEAVYGRSRLLRTAGTLGLESSASRATVALPGDIRRLVEAAYADLPTVPTEWQETACAADEERARDIAESRNRADSFRLRAIRELEGDLVNLLEDSTREAEDKHGGPRVRDSEDGIEVIVVQAGDGIVSYIDDLDIDPASTYAGQPIPTTSPPGDGLARALAATTVRLPYAMTQPPQAAATLKALENSTYEAWQHSRWLSGQLVLHLDSTRRTSLAGFDLTYDLHDGLYVTREEQK
ncbi:CRISPR-associated helicase Cas3' [Nocardioides sp. NPDC057764]|uniref:CRISPR-associated helicase Cas3' n=1 Tax=Nocardioides sp. NPDC057764 TaxID=3346243 RepID=UPI00366E25EB